MYSWLMGLTPGVKRLLAQVDFPCIQNALRAAEEHTPTVPPPVLCILVPRSSWLCWGLPFGCHTPAQDINLLLM